MKKILIIGATAAMLGAGSVLAAGPTMYGKIHMSLDVMDNGGEGAAQYDDTSLNSNSSRIGVKGSEDIGNGNSIGYLIEWGVDMDDGDNDMATRNRAIMLNTADYGSFLVGKWDTPMKLLGRKVDLFGDQVGDLRNMTSMNNNAYSITTIDQRWDNVLQYKTPNISGFNATVAYSTDVGNDDADFGVEDSGDNQNNDAYSANVMYDNGPLMVGVGFETIDSAGIVSIGNADDQTAWRIAGSYEVIENLDVLASYTDIENAVFVKGFDTNVSTVGAAYQMGNNKLKFQYAVRDDLDKIKDSGSDMTTIGLDHYMSTRTTVYAAYSMTNNDDYAGSTPWLSGHDSGTLGAVGEDADVFSVGLIHKF